MMDPLAIELSRTTASAAKAWEPAVKAARRQGLSDEDILKVGQATNPSVLWAMLSALNSFPAESPPARA